MVVSTRRSAKQFVSKDDIKKDNQLDYRGLLFILSAFLFMLYFNRPTIKYSIDELVEHKELNYDYLAKSFIVAKPEPQPTNIDIEIEEIVALSTTNLTSKYFTTISGILLSSDNFVYHQTLENSCNGLFFQLMELEQTNTNRKSLYQTWIYQINNVLGGENIYRLQEYYKTFSGGYRLKENHIFWTGENINGVVDISIYKSNSWVNHTSILVY